MDSAPKKRGRWAHEEKAEVISLIQDGQTVEQISQLIRRNSESINYEISKHIRNEIKKGYTRESIAKSLNLPSETIEDFLNPQQKSGKVDRLKAKCRKLKEDADVLSRVNKNLEVKLALEVSRNRKLQFENNKLKLENSCLDMDVLNFQS